MDYSRERRTCQRNNVMCIQTSKDTVCTAPSHSIARISLCVCSAQHTEHILWYTHTRAFVLARIRSSWNVEHAYTLLWYRFIRYRTSSTATMQSEEWEKNTRERKNSEPCIEIEEGIFFICFRFSATFWVICGWNQMKQKLYAN